MVAGAGVEEVVVVAAAAGFPKLKPPVAGAAVAAGVDVPGSIVVSVRLDLWTYAIAHLMQARA